MNSSLFVSNSKTKLAMDSDKQATKNPFPYPHIIGGQLSHANNKHIAFYSNLTEEAVAGLVKKSKTVRYIRAGAMADESNQSGSFFIIHAGKINVTSGDSKKTFVIHDFDTAVILKEIAVLSDQFRSTPDITFERTVFSTITKREFANWLRDYPDVKFKQTGNVCEKTRVR